MVIGRNIDSASQFEDDKESHFEPKQSKLDMQTVAMTDPSLSKQCTVQIV
jgi:hypothetical protein